MSGTPAPNSPVDWYWQCEIAAPGFLKEGNPQKFRYRMGLYVKEDTGAGIFPKLVTWRDSEDKCDVCGQPSSSAFHDETLVLSGVPEAHNFIKGKNEVAYLYKRMAGLVLVIWKKDCLSLPDKVYRIEDCKPTATLLRSAQLVAARATTTIQALTLLRELSDGFQYVEEATGLSVDCPNCNGVGEIRHWFDPEHPDEVVDPETIKDPQLVKEQLESGRLQETKRTCITCKGEKKVPELKRTTKTVPCPKDEKLLDLLEENEDIGRIVIFAGFTGSIDRVVEIVHKAGWATVRVDGRGWACRDEKGDVIKLDPLDVFQDLKEKYPRVAFIGHPGSGGMGITLTAASMIVYWSNDFNAEYRIQSEDRIHRPGMDENRGATIVDLIHLPTDLHVLDNLKLKRDLQAMSLGDMTKILDSVTERVT